MNLSDLNFYDIGNKIGLVGAVFGDDDSLFLCMFPDQPVFPDQHILQMDLDDWQKFLRQIDILETEVLQQDKHGKLSKAILRKSQRLIEQRTSWQVYKRDGYRCRYCGADGVPLTVDHLVLWEEGGPSIPANLVAACRKCNKTRGNIQYDDWLHHQYYQEVSRKLTTEQRAANEDLAATLGRIPRRQSTRNSR